MVSSLEVPVRAQKAELTLPTTGSVKRTKVAFPLVYTGSAPEKVLGFVAKAAGESVSIELSYLDRPTNPFRATVKLTGARLRLPGDGDDHKVGVVVSLVLSREDTREPRELLEFLLEAAHADALELELKAKVVQEPLPFEEERDDGRVLAGPGRRRRPKGSSPPPP